MLHPVVWQTVEVSFDKHNNEQHLGLEKDENQSETEADQLASLSRTDNFFQFFHQICSSVVDLNLEIYMMSTKESMSKNLDAIFQIRSLQRFRCKFINNEKTIKLGPAAARTSKQVNEYHTSSVPACKDLKLLNLEFAKGLFIYPKVYQILFSVSKNYHILRLLTQNAELA